MHQKNSATDPATHVVVGKEHVRCPTTIKSDEMEVFEVGDPITPTDAELRAFSDRLVTVDSAGRVIEDNTKDTEADELTPEEQAAHTYR